MSAKTKATPAEPTSPLMHFWMVFGVIHFKKDEEVIGIGANVLATTPEKKFNHSAMDKVHREFARRVYEEHGVNPNDISGITLQTINWLGEMTEEEMFGARPAPVAPAPEAPANEPVHPAHQ